MIEHNINAKSAKAAWLARWLCHRGSSERSDGTITHANLSPQERHSSRDYIWFACPVDGTAHKLLED
jgi:hypothetical protein